MLVERVPIDSIAPDPNNARLHAPRSLEGVAGSLRQFGQQKPIVVDEHNIIVAGSGTWQAAKQLGWTELFITRTTLTAAQRTAYALADNRTAELSEWDYEAVSAQIQAIGEEDAQLLTALGWTDDELEVLKNLEFPKPSETEALESFQRLKPKYVDSIPVSAAERDIIERAVRLYRQVAQQDALTEGAVMALLADAYVQSQGGPPSGGMH